MADEELGPLPAGRHGFTREQVAHNQRERLIAGLAGAVAEKGYRAVTITDITKQARVSRRVFYENFESKEECFLAAFDEAIDAAAEVFGELLDPEQDWAEQISSGLEIALEMVANEPARARLCIVEAQAAGGEALGRYQGMLERIAPKLREGRVHNPRASRLPDGLEVAIVGGLVWLVHQRLIAGRENEIKGLLPEMLQVTLTPYVGEVEAGRAADAAQARAAAA